MINAPAQLVGLGLYTPAEASRLIGVNASTLRRWLQGHSISGKAYEPLWASEVPMEDGSLYLSFRDLMEARVAWQFLSAGLSPHKLRQAIIEASKVAGERPLATRWLKTDGRTVFLEIVSEDPDTEPQLLDLFKKQYAFSKIVQRSLKDVVFSGNEPAQWWPGGKASGVVVDPARSFGAPIERDSSVPTARLAAAVKAEGSEEKAARAWGVSLASVRKAVTFEASYSGQALAA